MIERAPNPQDQRSHLLALTAQGRELYGRIAPKALAIEAQIFGGFKPAELRAFVSMLERIDAAAYAAREA